MSSETILHALEFLNTVYTFGLVLRINKTREGFSELRPTRTVWHTAQTWAVPIYFAGDRIKSGLASFIGAI